MFYLNTIKQLFLFVELPIPQEAIDEVKNKKTKKRPATSPRTNEDKRDKIMDDENVQQDDDVVVEGEMVTPPTPSGDPAANFGNSYMVQNTLTSNLSTLKAGQHNTVILSNDNLSTFSSPQYSPTQFNSNPCDTNLSKTFSTPLEKSKLPIKNCEPFNKTTPHSVQINVTSPQSAQISLTTPQNYPSKLNNSSFQHQITTGEVKLTGESIMDNYSENSFLISGNSSINSSKHQTALTMYTQGEHNISSSTQIHPDISPPVKIPQNNETLEIDHEDEFANVNFCTNTYNFSQLSNSPEYSIGNPSINQNRSTINNCRRVLPENVFNKNDTLPISPTPNISMLRTNEHQITPPLY